LTLEPKLIVLRHWLIVGPWLMYKHFNQYGSNQ